MKLRRNYDISIESHPFVNKDFNTDNPFAYEIMKNGEEILIN